jgi:dGTPase
LGEVAAAACLAHDLGNPPFGHSGEDAIAAFFQSDAGAAYLNGLTEAQRADLTRFEGNALGFRLLARTRPKQSKKPGGLGLTFATLGAFSKYPRPALPLGRPNRASEKKFGFFQAETSIFEEVAQAVGLLAKPEGYGWCRHPIAFLVEAADDICYRIIDFEDGYRLNLVPFDVICRLFKQVIEACEEEINEEYVALVLERQEQVGYLRARVINALIHSVARAFAEHIDAVLAGSFDSNVLDLTKAAQPLKEIKRVTSEEIYSHRPVIQVEAAGFQVLGGLLLDFLSASWEHPSSKRAGKVLDLIPDVYKEDARGGGGQYAAIMSLVEYVASMTDTYAIDTYRTLRGIELPTY